MLNLTWPAEFGLLAFTVAPGYFDWRYAVADATEVKVCPSSVMLAAEGRVRA